MTLRQTIINDTSGVFLDEDDFAEQWEMHPAGDASSAVDVVVVPRPDDLEGSREVHGDGRVLHQDQTRIRDSVVIELAVTVAITEPAGTGQIADRWVAKNGEIYHTKRIISKDFAMQRVLVVKVRDKVTRKGAYGG